MLGSFCWVTLSFAALVKFLDDSKKTVSDTVGAVSYIVDCFKK